MSVDLHSKALKANLSANLKAVLLALCDACGEDDGTKCYPSLSYIAFKAGYSIRHTQRILRALEAVGYIEPVAYATGGHGKATDYHIHIKRVPMRPDWEDVKAALLEHGESTEDGDVLAAVRRLKRNHGKRERQSKEAQA